MKIKYIILCIVLAALFSIASANTYSDSGVFRAGYNQWGYDTNLWGWGIHNGTLNGTNFNPCNTTTEKSVWNGSGFGCYQDIVGSSYNATYDAKPTLTTVNQSAVLQSISQILGLQGLFDALNTTISDHSTYANDTFVTYAEYDGEYNVVQTNITELQANVTKLQANESADRIYVNASIEKSRQMAFEISTNTSGTLSDELVLIPYDFYLMNISTLLNNNTGYFNYSVNKYTNYPTSKNAIGTINASAYLSISDMDETILYRNNVVELQFNNRSNVTNVVILFELLRK